MCTTAVQTQTHLDLDWHLWQHFQREGKGGERERKGRRVLAAHAHTRHCALAWPSGSCKTPKVLSLWALSFPFTQKPPMQAEGLSSLFTVHVAKKDRWASHLSGKTSSWNQIGLQKAKQTGDLQEYWLKYSGWFPHMNTRVNPPPLQTQNTWSQARGPSREENE